MGYRRIVILTGAGISKESGLDTFRDADGLWTKVRLEDVATPGGFARDPGHVHDFHNRLRAGMAGYRPNAAHLALAELERAHPGRVLVVTQNVDDLHERAGSRNLLHMHGEILKVRCDSCGTVGECRAAIGTDTACPACAAAGFMRPDVVWFEEMPFHMAKIGVELAACDLFVSIGTSGNVYPAAGFVDEVRRHGRAHTVELNLEPSEGASLFAEARRGPATELVPAFVAELLAGSP